MEGTLTMGLMGVSVTGGDDHVWLGDKDVLEGGGGWSAPDAQRMRYTLLEPMRRKMMRTRYVLTQISFKFSVVLGWPLTLFAPKYLTGTESGLQVWLIVTSAGTLPISHWMFNMKERDTGEIAPGQGLVIKSYNVVLAIRWPIK
ncbi:hypothetical protein F5888DRAFT_950073 [Russula emetica]|nr:hypothetical protein F5888DRAFT_950073 [Russula emetica]